MALCDKAVTMFCYNYVIKIMEIDIENKEENLEPIVLENELKPTTKLTLTEKYIILAISCILFISWILISEL